VNIEDLRKSLRAQWLTYYRDNRSWLTRLGVWVTCEGERRPSSSFILGTLSILEPQLVQLLPLIVDLSSNPDRIVIALGLNFNPDEELEKFEKAEPVMNGHTPQVRMLPEGSQTVEVAVQRQTREREIVERKPVKAPPEPTPPIASTPPAPPKQPEPSALPIQSPPPEPLSSPAPSTPTSPPAERPVQSVTPSPPVFENQFSVVRPVIDSVELSAGELPTREIDDSNPSSDERTTHSAR
jgi:outer membrane biosynthesis protein TonB